MIIRLKKCISKIIFSNFKCTYLKFKSLIKNSSKYVTFKVNILKTNVLLSTAILEEKKSDGLFCSWTFQNSYVLQSHISFLVASVNFQGFESLLNMHVAHFSSQFFLRHSS